MKDTSPEVEEVYNKMIMEKTGEERLKMGFSMFDFARKQAIASIKKDHPDSDKEELRKKLFLRFYGGDFSQEELRKIIQKIGEY
jgi:hypothetical protein